MSTRSERKARYRRWNLCPRCQQKGAHYVPASFGDEGFYLCTQHLVNGKAVDLAAPRRPRSMFETVLDIEEAADA